MDGFAGNSGFLAIVIAGAPGGQADLDPTGGPIAGARKTGLLDKALDQVDGMSVLLLPVRRQPRGDPPQQMAGQVWHTHPRQNEQTRVVGDQPQMAAALVVCPADPLIACGAPPRRRAEKQTGQGSAILG